MLLLLVGIQCPFTVRSMLTYSRSNHRHPSYIAECRRFINAIYGGIGWSAIYVIKRSAGGFCRRCLA